MTAPRWWTMLWLIPLLSGCTSPAPAVPEQTAPATPGGQAAGTSSTAGSPSPARASGTVTPPPASPRPSPTAASVPPAAVLTLGRSRHEGELGTYVYQGAGADAPWLPSRALDRVPAKRGAPMVFSLEQGAVVAWSIRFAPAGDAQGAAARRHGERDAGSPARAIRIPSLPAGRWVLEVRVVYADEAGDGAYYWYLDVR